MTRALHQLIRETLAQRHVLLLLDNCEHLLPALATLIAELLAAAPQLVILATSRVILRLSQERRYQLAPLGLPASDLAIDAHPTRSPAVSLFVERAQAVRPDVALDSDAIAAICCRLDGLPLAIELAATRARLLSPRDLLARLTQRLPLLKGGSRDLPQRQQTLHAAIDWSYRLLEPHQQALLRRLAVFAGGWTVAAAEAVCADPPGAALDAAVHVLDGLTALLDASLITETTNAAGEPRCTMLETIREYALEQLAACGELAATQQRHSDYVATLADAAKRALTGKEGVLWTARLHAEYSNLNAALRWTLDHNEVETALRIGGGVWRFWWRSGFAREGLDWLTEALSSEHAVAAQTRAEALRAAGVLAWAVADYSQAHRWLEEGLELARTLADRYPEAAMYTMLGILNRSEGAFEQARAYFEQSRAVSATLPDRFAIRFAIMGLAIIDTRLGHLDEAAIRYRECIALNGGAGDDEGVGAAKCRLAKVYCLQQHNYPEAEKLCMESMELCRVVDDQQGLSETLLVLGNLAREQGDYARATSYYQDSLLLRNKLGKHEHCAETLEALAINLGRASQDEYAVQLMSAAVQTRAAMSAPLTSFEQAAVTPWIEVWRARLGDATFAELWRLGQVLSLEQATQLAMGVM